MYVYTNCFRNTLFPFGQLYGSKGSNSIRLTKQTCVDCCNKIILIVYAVNILFT